MLQLELNRKASPPPATSGQELFVMREELFNKKNFLYNHTTYVFSLAEIYPLLSILKALLNKKKISRKKVNFRRGLKLEKFKNQFRSVHRKILYPDGQSVSSSMRVEPFAALFWALDIVCTCAYTATGDPACLPGIPQQWY